MPVKKSFCSASLRVVFQYINSSISRQSFPSSCTLLHTYLVCLTAIKAVHHRLVNLRIPDGSPLVSRMADCFSYFFFPFVFLWWYLSFTRRNDPLVSLRPVGKWFELDLRMKLIVLGNCDTSLKAICWQFTKKRRIWRYSKIDSPMDSLDFVPYPYPKPPYSVFSYSTNRPCLVVSWIISV